MATFETVHVDPADRAGVNLWAEGGWPGADPEGPELAAWVGSPFLLGAHGVHRDAPVTQEAVERVLTGQGARDARRVRSPEIDRSSEGGAQRFEILEARWAVPPAVSTLLSQGDPREKASIAQALRASTEAALEDLRRTTYLVERQADGRPVRELAHGLAAVVVVRRDTSHDTGENLEPPRFEVSTSVFAVEGSDGKLYSPHTRGLAGYEIADDPVALGHQALAGELTKLGYSVTSGNRFGEALEVGLDPPTDPPARETAPRMVGRGEVWVRDAFDQTLRDYLGHSHADQLDEDARLKGEELASLGHAEFDAVLAELAEFDRPDMTNARACLEADAEVDAGYDRLWRAQEDLMVIEGRVGEPEAAHVIDEALAVHRDRLGSRGNELSSLVKRHLELQQPAREWAENPQAIQWIAAQREQAVRQREGALYDRGATELVSGEPATESGGREGRQRPPNAVVIGRGDVATILERRREVEELGGELLRETGAARHIERHEVEVSKELDQLGLIGTPRQERLRRRMKPLADWLMEHQSERWVRERCGELPPPGEIVDRAAARYTVRIEAAEKAVRESLAVADDDFEVEGLEEQLAELRVELSALRGQGLYFGDSYAREEDNLIRSLAHHDEVRARDERENLQKVERLVQRPSELVQRLVGPADRSAPEHPEWVSLVRDLEYARLTDPDFDPDRPFAWESNDDERNGLVRRVNGIREARGMWPLEPEHGRAPAIESGGLEPSF